MTDVAATVATSRYSSLLLIIIGVARSYPASIIACRSNSSSRSPGCTLSPTFTRAVNGLPSSFTVSIPTWINTSIPLLLSRPMACLVWNSEATTPANGATTLLSEGIIAAPLPSRPLANVVSGTWSRARTVPVIGDSTSFSPAETTFSGAVFPGIPASSVRPQLSTSATTVPIMPPHSVASTPPGGIIWAMVKILAKPKE